MTLEIRGKSDGAMELVREALSQYEAQHPAAQIVIYRQNSVSLRIRIIDPDFAATTRADRHDVVWRLFEELPDDVQSQISILLLLTAEEANGSFANVEFDHPVPLTL